MAEKTRQQSGESADISGRPTAALLHSPNRFKLAVFGMNVSGGCSMTSAEGTIKVDWPETRRLAQMADRVGIEALIPVARWRGFGGETNFNDRCFETFTWAAGVAAVTERIQVFTTVHVPTVHPVRAAKEGATIDHISGGRFGINLVAGSNEQEALMFGEPLKSHDERYRVFDEWTTLTRRLWTEDTFDFKGAFFHAPGAHSEPKPIQRPGPVLMAAGASPAGTDFAAKHADVHFISFVSLEGAAEKVRKIKHNAREKYGRDIKVMSLGHIVCRDTEKEAKDYYDYYVHEKGDWKAANNMVAGAVPNQVALVPEMITNLVAGFGALPLMGTPDQVVQGMAEMADAGLDGITISWLDYECGLEQFGRVLLPRLQAAGLRA